MGPYVMFVEYQEANGSLHKGPPLLMEATTEKEASTEAIAKANSLFPTLATQVLIQVVSGDSSGRPIAEIRRPISN